MGAAVDFEQPFGVDRRVDLRGRQARRGRAAPGSRADRRRGPADAWRRNGAARAASRSPAGRARRAAAPSRAGRCAATAARPLAPTNSGPSAGSSWGQSAMYSATSVATCASTGTMRFLLPLPVTVMTSPLPGAGKSSARKAKRLGDAQARAVEQRQHGGIAGENPRLALLAGAQVGIGDALGGRDGERLRQRLRHLRRPHGGERADLALAVAFEEARERARARQHPHQRAAADAVRAPRRHEGAHVGWGRGSPSDARMTRRPRCSARNGQELPDVAAIGFDRLRRHPPLGARDGRASARPRPRRRGPRRAGRRRFARFCIGANRPSRRAFAGT